MKTFYKLAASAAIVSLAATSANAAVDAGITTLLADVGTTWDSVVVLGLGILSVVLVIAVVKKLRRIS